MKHITEFLGMNSAKYVYVISNLDDEPIVTSFKSDGALIDSVDDWDSLNAAEPLKLDDAIKNVTDIIVTFVEADGGKMTKSDERFVEMKLRDAWFYKFNKDKYGNRKMQIALVVNSKKQSYEDLTKLV